MLLTELFLSLQGETRASGLPTVFIRTAGCNLTCQYCDTSFAQDSSAGTEFSVDAILRQVGNFGIKRVTLTGGEPLCQDETPELCRALLEAGYSVQVETNGSRDISVLPQGVRVILDIKTPGSGMETHNDLENIPRLKADDELKFVITSKGDYTWAVEFITNYDLTDREVLFSPVTSQCDAKDLAAWILYDRLEHVRMQLQLHAFLWPDERSR